MEQQKAQRFFAEWERMRVRLRAFALSLTGQKQRAEDLMEQTYDQILYERQAWTEEKPLFTHACWVLKGIRANDARRRSRLGLQAISEEEDSEPAAPDSGPERKVERAEQAPVVERVVRKFFASLQEGTLEHKVAQRALRGEARNVAEMAGALGVHPRQITLALTSLKRKFKDLCEAEGLELTDVCGVSMSFLEEEP